ncbi:hypothetical conserved protein [Oceanobacillus iheyensis HTE831]|uniref:Hypothetical conserved protein n=1 Tax=Oceanobacillus iheyensis (strain DSM 14371 / CIP 107618 / JCM 11309 / KCTC 3954 / HTE831) TaxID=221109 RepID=Q8CV27_OCEIH|nr:hypothetical conserved protein [Oceanobacillus iheyensis HTE831]
MVAMKEFLSSLLLIISWFIFAVSAYLLYCTIIMPMLAIIPLLISFVIGFLCFYLSRKLDDRRKNY